MSCLTTSLAVSIFVLAPILAFILPDESMMNRTVDGLGGVGLGECDGSGSVAVGTGLLFELRFATPATEQPTRKMTSSNEGTFRCLLMNMIFLPLFVDP